MTHELGFSTLLPQHIDGLYDKFSPILSPFKVTTSTSRLSPEMHVVSLDLP